MGISLSRALYLFLGEGSRQHTMDLHFFILYNYLFICWITFFSPHQFSCSRTLSCMLMPYPTSNCIFFQGKHGQACNVSFICCGDGNSSHCIILSISLTNFHYFPNLFHGIDRICLSPSQDTLLWLLRQSSQSPLQFQGIILNNPSA